MPINSMQVSSVHLKQFHRQGFFLIPRPFGQVQLENIDRLQVDNHERWRTTDWPSGLNRLACQFLMLGEPLLKLVEKPEIVAMAQQILESDQVHVNACGIGDSLSNRSQPQVPWHCDGDNCRQVSFRTALDRHDQPNAPLRFLPGSDCRSHEEVQLELMQFELATGRHDKAPARKQLYAKHPDEIEVILDPRWTLVWSPSCWHATGVKTSVGQRRAIGWNYSTDRDQKHDKIVRAVKHVFNDQWHHWTQDRKKLWAVG